MKLRHGFLTLDDKRQWDIHWKSFRILEKWNLQKSDHKIYNTLH